MRNFETFNRDLPRCNVRPQITVLRSGMLSLNKAAYLTLEAPSAVELLYDADNRVIGLRPVEPRAGTAHIVRRPSRGSNGPFMITAIAFTRFYEIDTTQSLRRDAFIEDEVLCVCLDGPAVAVTSNRAGSKADVLALPRPDSALHVADGRSLSSQAGG